MTNACGVNSAESNRVILRYLFEDPTCWGVPLTSGKPREMRITSSSLAATKHTKVSAEIRADRMVPNIIEVGAMSGGDIAFELSAGSLDDFLQAFVLGAWTRPMTFDKFSGTSVSVASTSTVEIAGGDYTPYFVVGRRIKLEGFLTPANNTYFQVAAVAYASGATTVTMTESALVVEVGNAYAKIIDANDVITMKSTVVRFGTGGAHTLDTNGGNGFSAALAAGQLVVGQRIYVEGLGYGEGTVTLSGLPADGDTVIIADGSTAVVFEFDSNSAYVRGRIPVTIGADAAATGVNLRIAINSVLNQRKALVSAKDDGAGEVTVRNARGVGGNITSAAANTAVVSFAGGDASLHGFATILSATADVITLDKAITTNANAGAHPVTIKGSHLRNSGNLAQIVKQSVTVETGFSDVSQYFLQNGLRVGSFELKVTAGDIVTGKLGFDGKVTSVSGVSTFGNAPYTPLASTATEVLNATTNVGAIRKNGAALSTAIQSIDIKGDASLRQLKGVSSKYPVGIAYGRISVTGKIVAYFESTEMYQHFINHETISLGFDFADNDFNAYTITLPAIKITSDPISPSGVDQDILEEMSFTSQRDPVLNTQFMVDRWSSVLPPTA